MPPQSQVASPKSHVSHTSHVTRQSQGVARQSQGMSPVPLTCDLELFVSERPHRIHLRRAMRWNKAGGERDEGEGDGGGDEDRRIGTLELEEERLREAAEADRGR